MVKRKNPKRFECLKKKANELSVLCDVDVLFLCKEDGDGDFYMWPENSGACLTMIEKYKKKGDSVLGKKRVRDETQVALSGTIQANQESAKKARKFENPKMGLGNNFVGVVNCLEYQELLQVISWVEQTTKEVDGHVQFLMNTHNLAVNEGLCINGIGRSENLDSGVEYGLWLEEVLGGSQQISDQSSLEGGECDMGDTDNNVFDVKKLEEWLENDDQESDVDVSNNEFIAAFEEEMGQILHASNQDHVLVDNLEEEHTAFEAEMRQILQANNQDRVLVDNLEEEEHAAFEAEMRQILQASNQDCVLVNSLEEKDHEDDEEENEDENLMNSHEKHSEIVDISDTSDDDDEEEEEEEEKVELIPSSHQWMLLDFLDHPLI